MRILLDTNVVLDVAFERQPFYAAASRILDASDFDRIHLFITASMATDVYYVLRKAKGREVALGDFYQTSAGIRRCVPALTKGFSSRRWLPVF